MRTLGLGLLIPLVACGEGPGFREITEREQAPSQLAATDGVKPEGASGDLEGSGGDNETSVPDGTDNTAGDLEQNDGKEEQNNNSSNPQPLSVPEAEPGDMAAISKCLKQWRKSPFSGTVDNFKRIYASVTVGTTGNAISDTERTEDPMLILIDAGVNVFGTPKYELLNPNGWYCIKANVNVGATLAIDLHCGARLADGKVNVNVGSTQSSSTAAVGVHVFSTVTVNNIKPSGDKCIR